MPVGRDKFQKTTPYSAKGTQLYTTPGYRRIEVLSVYVKQPPYVKRKGQEQFHKVEIQKGPLREYDVISREQVQQRVIASYFKQVKIRELRIWKGDVRSLAGMIGEMTDIC